MKKTLISLLGVVAVGCGGQEATVETTDKTGITYDQFLTMVFQEPTGEYIANGDEMFEDGAALKQFFDEHIAVNEQSTAKQGLAIYNINGSDVRWSAAQARNLTYCVSTGFGSNYSAVVSAMQSATSAWESAANVNFVHNSSQDSNCTSRNNNVLFNVSPVNVNGQYLARAFFPNSSRRSRNVLIDGSAFQISGNPTLTGILRHELGHTLGFRHEHTRPESGACFEDNRWRALTPYDSSSVMHYPQCNGTGDWSLTLTSRDISGARSVYP